MTTLNQTLKAIARAAPNDWDAFKNGERTDRGTSLPYDYEILPHDEGKVVFYPVSNPARERFYASFPDDCPRWGVEGWVVEQMYVTGITNSLKRDGLVSEDDYELNMNLEQQRQDEAGCAIDFAEYMMEDR